jgi:hypothetical protein
MKCRSVGLGCAALVCILLNTGCGGSGTSNNTVPSQQESPPGAYNSYVGTQGTGDVWQLSINQTTNSFGATDFALQAQSGGAGGGGGLTGTGGFFNGIFAFDGGFLNFTRTNINPAFQPMGFTFEIPDQLVFLRPDYAYPNQAFIAQPPVAAVPGSCLNISSPETFQFVTLPNADWLSGSQTAYGSFQVATAGSTWNFSNLNQLLLSNSPSQPGASFSPGVCTAARPGTVISIPPSSTITTNNTLIVGPSGFLIMNQGAGTSSWVGMMQPVNALNTGNVANANYLGFISEPNIPFPGGPGQPPPSEIVAFGCPTSGCTSSTLVGGAFPLSNSKDSTSDDPTQPAGTDITINLGNQSTASSGLYDSVSITVPDPNKVCTGSASGKDAKGNPVCTFPAVAIAGNPDNKFAIFVIAQDIVNSSPMAIYLLQE